MYYLLLHFSFLLSIIIVLICITPFWSCKLKAICSPVKIPLGTLNTGQDESKMTNIEMIERCPFEKIASFHILILIAAKNINAISLFSLIFSTKICMKLYRFQYVKQKDAIFSKGQHPIISTLAILDSSRPIFMLRTRILTGEQTCFNLQLQNGVIMLHFPGYEVN